MNKNLVLNQKGFSLVELMAVVAIMGILAIIAIPQYQKFRVKAFQAEAKTQLAALHTAQRAFYLEYQGYHSSLKVLGYAPHGKARYNVGFGAIGVVPPQAPVETVQLSSKLVCGGTFGAGTDTNCNMIIDTPDISADATVTSSTYLAAALSYDDLLVAKTENTTGLDVAAQFLFGDSAHADPIVGSTLNEQSIDGWFIDENNRLIHQKLKPDCIASGTCHVSENPSTGI